jgi:hypothetical protein
MHLAAGLGDVALAGARPMLYAYGAHCVGRDAAGGERLGAVLAAGLGGRDSPVYALERLNALLTALLLSTGARPGSS